MGLELYQGRTHEELGAFIILETIGHLHQQVLGSAVFFILYQGLTMSVLQRSNTKESILPQSAYQRWVYQAHNLDTPCSHGTTPTAHEAWPTATRYQVENEHIEALGH